LHVRIEITARTDQHTQIIRMTTNTEIGEWPLPFFVLIHSIRF